MKQLVYKDINESVYFHKMRNGLSVYILPKEGYHKTFVTLSTPLGSTVKHYTKNGNPIELPDGIAHFLEHKLFDRGEFDVSELFAQQGAQVNAYTMNTRTTYLFSCTDQLSTNIHTLLDFVFHPQFTTEGILHEIDIISQEIKMYEDDPNTAAYMGMMRQLYKEHPVQYDILGTIESISTITKELLEDVHQTFYHPSQMVLFITGKVDPEAIIPIIEQGMTTTFDPLPDIKLHAYNEPKDVSLPIGSREMDVMMPNQIIGYKLRPNNQCHKPIMKQELIYSIVTDMLLGKSTHYYEELLEQGVINDSFGIDVTIEEDYSFLLIGSQTKYPDQLAQAIFNIFESVKQTGFDPAHFERTKKLIVGGFIQALNSLEYIANQFTKYHFMGSNLFTILDVAASIELSDIEEAFELLFEENIHTVFTVMPKQKT